MCQFSKSLKFCTCTDEVKNKSNIYLWTLKRFQSVDWMQLEQGCCHTPSYSKNERLDAISILNVLKSQTFDCYDFKYEPIEGDVLNIYLPAQFNKSNCPTLCYEFIYTTGRWSQELSISEHLNVHLLLAKGHLIDSD